MLKRWLAWLLAVLMVGAAGPAFGQTGRLEIFSWWAGDEGPALEALIRRYNLLYPRVTVESATVVGGAGVVARAVLKTRMLGGEPPDSFQIHAGQALISTWVVANRIEDLTFLWRTNQLVGSLAHGAVAKEAFQSEFATVVEIFLTTRRAMAAANAAQAIADQVGLGRR